MTLDAAIDAELAALPEGLASHTVVVAEGKLHRLPNEPVLLEKDTDPTSASGYKFVKA